MQSVVINMKMNENRKHYNREALLKNREALLKKALQQKTSKKS